MDNKTRYFGERSCQVEPSCLLAFGISISSRDGRASELVEMLDFASAACREEVSQYVQEVFYDSKNSYISFTFTEQLDEMSDVARAIYRVAMRTLLQFEWFGSMAHGEKLTGAEYDEMERDSYDSGR